METEEVVVAGAMFALFAAAWRTSPRAHVSSSMIRVETTLLHLQLRPR